VFPPANGSLTGPMEHGFSSVARCGAPEHRSSLWLEPPLESLLESPVKEHSVSPRMFSVSVILIAQVWEKIQSIKQSLIPSRTNYIWEVVWYPRAHHSRQIHPCHSSHMHGAHTEGLGLFFKVSSFRSAVFCANRVTSYKMWLFNMRIRSSHLPPLENRQQPASGLCYHPVATRRPWRGPANSP
jgi:hypothetical protein